MSSVQLPPLGDSRKKTSFDEDADYPRSKVNGGQATRKAWLLALMEAASSQGPTIRLSLDMFSGRESLLGQGWGGFNYQRVDDWHLKLLLRRGQRGASPTKTCRALPMPGTAEEGIIHRDLQLISILMKTTPCPRTKKGEGGSGPHQTHHA